MTSFQASNNNSRMILPPASGVCSQAAASLISPQARSLYPACPHGSALLATSSQLLRRVLSGLASPISDHAVSRLGPDPVTVPCLSLPRTSAKGTRPGRGTTGSASPLPAPSSVLVGVSRVLKSVSAGPRGCLAIRNEHNDRRTSPTRPVAEFCSLRPEFGPLNRLSALWLQI